jgi:ribosome-binding protein aMBF1 (putative translation factor)
MELRVKPFGDRIREAREASDLTQAELGRRLGVSARTIQNWEHGSTPRPRHRRAIKRFLNGEAGPDAQSSPGYAPGSEPEGV